MPPSNRFAPDDTRLATIREALHHRPSKSLKIAFYISGHGYGHSTRAYVTIVSLLSRSHHVTVITGALPSLFSELQAKYADLISIRKSASIDPGVIQSDAVSVDATRSLAAVQDFFRGWEGACENEVRWLRDSGIECVLLDSPYVPAVAAKKAGLPTVLITNFSFDAIYSGIRGFSNPEGEIIKKLVYSMYSDNLDHLLRLPGSIIIPAFDMETSPQDQRILNLPLVVRMATKSKDEVRKALGIPLHTNVVLITFGGFSVTPSSSLALLTSNSTNGLNTHTLNGVTTKFDTITDEADGAERWTPASLLPDDWHAIIAVPGAKGDLLDALISQREQDKNSAGITITPANAYVPDLVCAADVVAGKCGYSTCAEVVAHKVPFVYVPRPLFAEEPGLLEQLMEPFGMSVEMPHSDFYAGNWAKYILSAYELKAAGPKRSIRLDGGAIAAKAVEMIMDKQF